MAEKKRKKAIKFKLDAPEAGIVSIAGNFNEWNMGSHTLRAGNNGNAKGSWEGMIHLEPGVYEYRFVVDGIWQDDPSCPEKTLNEFGTYNCVIRV